MNIITGGSGSLGSILLKNLPDFISYDIKESSEHDILDVKTFTSFSQELDPDIIIHLAEIGSSSQDTQFSMDARRFAIKSLNTILQTVKKYNKETYVIYTDDLNIQSRTYTSFKKVNSRRLQSLNSVIVPTGYVLSTLENTSQESPLYLLKQFLDNKIQEIDLNQFNTFGFYFNTEEMFINNIKQVVQSKPEHISLEDTQYIFLSIDTFKKLLIEVFPNIKFANSPSSNLTEDILPEVFKDYLLTLV